MWTWRTASSPTTSPSGGRGKVLAELKKKAKGAATIILATDPDREGEAIAYHVAEQLGFERKTGSDSVGCSSARSPRARFRRR